MVWHWTFLVFFSITHALIAPWYFMSIYPIYLLLVSIGTGKVWQWLGKWKPAAGFGLVLAGIALLPSFLEHSAGLWDELQEHKTKSELKKEAAEWLKENGQPPISVSSTDIGYLGYYCDCEVVDLLGLVVPRPIRYPGYRLMMLTYHPHYGFSYQEPWQGNPVLAAAEWNFRLLKTFQKEGATIQILEYEWETRGNWKDLTQGF